MYNTIKYSLLALFSLAVIAQAAPAIDTAVDDCKVLGENAEKSIYDVMMLGRESFPRTDEEIIAYCKEGEAAMKRFGEYKQCLKGLTRQVFSVIRANMKTVLRDNCKMEEKRKELLHHAKCLDRSNMPEVFRLLEVYATYIQLIAYNTSSLDILLPRTCCAVIIGRDVVYERAGALCDARTGPTTKEFVVDLVSKVASEALDLACGQYSTVSQCNEKQGNFTLTLRTIANETEAVSKDVQDAVINRKSFLLQPILKIANDLTL